MDQYLIYQRFSVGFRPVDHDGVNAYIVLELPKQSGHRSGHCPAPGGIQGPLHRHKVWQWVSNDLKRQILLGSHRAPSASQQHTDCRDEILRHNVKPFALCIHAGSCCRQHNVHRSFSQLFHICHMCSM